MAKNIASQGTLRQASTVILARECHSEFQVYLLRRSLNSGFMSGIYVFPGGNLSREDHDPKLFEACSRINSKAVSRFTGNELPFEKIFPFAVAAIRETFEEAGVLISLPGDNTDVDLTESHRRRINDDLEEGWFNDLVISRGMIPELISLARWSHWITPELMPMRFDTRFFITIMPDGQECMPDYIETIDGIWVTPEEGLMRNFNREISLSPPALITLHELLNYSTLDGLEKAIEIRQWGDPLFPRMIPSPDGALILEPWDPMRYLETDIETKGLESRILPVGQPFSRIWNCKGVWLPVGI